MSSKNRLQSGPLTLVMLAILFAFGGCSGDPNPPAGPKTCEPGETLLDDGRCQPAGLPLDMQCPPGELALEDGGCQPAGLPPDMACPPGEYEKESGGCEPAGIPPEKCAAGFMPDGNRGCEPILPADPCPDGMMAIPGDTVCREVMPCGSGDYGDIPVDATTQYVNAAYAGNDSNGTKAKPWKTIQAGVFAAAKGAIVAVAAGAYNEDVTIQGKAVKLWGRCPGMVEVKGTGNAPAAVRISGVQASGTELHGISVTGSKKGVEVIDSQGVALLASRIHDTGDIGVNIASAVDVAEVMLADCLLERASVIGLASSESTVVVERSAIRDTNPQTDGRLGRGVHVESYDGARARVTMRDSLVERNRDCGVSLLGADLNAEATVIRDTDVDGNGKYGLGIFAVAGWSKELSTVALVGSMIDRNQDAGVFLWGATGDIYATTIRNTQIRKDGLHAAGLEVLVDAYSGERSSVALTNSLIDQNHYVGIEVVGSDAVIEGTLVRASMRAGIHDSGAGISGNDDHNTKQRANVVVRMSATVNNESSGIDFVGSDGLIEATVVSQNHHGIEVEYNQVTGEVGKLVVRQSIVERNVEIGLMAAGGTAQVESSIIDSNFGLMPDFEGSGIELQAASGRRANAVLRGVLIQKNQGIGVLAFGSDLFIDGCVVRDTQSDASGHSRGVNVQASSITSDPGYAEIIRSIVARNGTIGVFAAMADVIIDATVVSEHGAASAVDSIGVVLEPGSKATRRTHGIIRTSVIEANRSGGVLNVGSDAEIFGTLVRDNELNMKGIWGRGIQVQADEHGARGILNVQGSIIENNCEAGIFVVDSEATMKSTLVIGTKQNGFNAFGDGVVAAIAAENVMEFDAQPPVVTITDSRIAHNARAGIANFGGKIVLTDSELVCHAFDLNGEDEAGYTWSFDGSSNNKCGCPEATGTCGAKSAGLEAPNPTVDPVGSVPPL